MAGNWIKMRHDLIDAPEVRRLARATGLDRDQVYGKLFRLWTWADRHGANGVIDAEMEDLDDQVGHDGFGAALVSVGWLDSQADGIVIPHWDRHNSDSAKVRALGKNRAEKHREADRNASSVTHPPDGVTQGALPDKRREEIPPPPPRVDAAQSAAALRAAWAQAAKAGHVKPYRAKALPNGAEQRLAEPGWLEEALQAIEHLPRCKFFTSPATLHQLVGDGFVARVLGGQYDEPRPAREPRVVSGGADRLPPREWSGDDRDRFEATKRAMAAKLQEAG